MRIWMIGTQARPGISSEHSWDCFPNFVTFIPLCVFTLSRSGHSCCSLPGPPGPLWWILMFETRREISKLITFPDMVSDLLKQTNTNKQAINLCGREAWWGWLWSWPACFVFDSPATETQWEEDVRKQSGAIISSTGTSPVSADTCLETGAALITTWGISPV